MQVIKRDGRIAEFNPERIVKAITLAMSQTPGGVDIDLANKIAANVEKSLEGKMQASVYEIQDLVENHPQMVWLFLMQISSSYLQVCLHSY